MASILNWRHWTGAWTGEQTNPLSYVVNIESLNYANKSRTCVAISLSALNNTLKRKTLTLNLELLIAHYYPSSLGTIKSIEAALTKSGPSSGTYETQGTVYSYASANVSHSSVGATPGIALNFDISNLDNSAQTVYVYIYGLNHGVDINYQYKINSGSVSEATATATTAVTTGSITTSAGQIFLPSGQVTVSWNSGSDGVGNKIASYTAYVKIGSAPTASAYTHIKTGITGTSYTFTLSNAQRGQSVYVGVQAIGSVSGYNGSVETKSIGTINTLPAAPTISSVSGTNLNYTTSIEYKITAGSTGDSSQSPTLYYSIGSGGKNKFTSPLKISLGSSFKQGSNTLNFYTYDGLEYSSSATQHIFDADFAPIITSGTPKCSHTTIKNMSGSSALATSSTITFGMSGGSASNVTVYVRKSDSTSLSGNGSVLNSSYYSYNSSTKTITIDITKLPTSVVGYGQYFDFAFTVTDGTYTSDKTGFLTAGRRPKLPNQPTLGTCRTDIGTTTANGYFKKYIDVSWSGPSSDAGCPAISSTQLIATYGSSSSTPTITGGSHRLELASLATGTKVTLSIKVIDILGNTATSSSSITFIKTDYIYFITQTTSVNPTTYRPMTRNSITLDFAHSKAKSQSSSISYSYFIEIGSNKQSLSGLYSSSTVGEQITINIPNSQKDKLKDLLRSAAGGSNSLYDAKFIVTATDGYGDSVSVSKDFKVEFREAPAFNNSNFDLRHDFKIGRTSASPNDSVQIPQYSQSSTSAQKDIIMFNPGEGLIFQLPKANDPNGDITKYQIFVSENNLSSNGDIPSVSSSSVVFQSTAIKEPSISSLTSSGDYYYYRFNVPSYSVNKYLYFKIRVADSQGNYSDEIKSSKCIICCRTAAPQFSVSGLSLDKLGDTIKLKYGLSITDLGGSATQAGWNETFYLNFRNLERDLKTAQNFSGTTHLLLYVDISDTSGFGSYIRSTQESSSNIYKFTSSEITFQKTSDNTSTWNKIIEGSKIYVRFRVRIRMGIGSSDGSTEYSYVYSPFYSDVKFMAMPTVAHRVNAVGINTKTLGSDEVLVVENFDNRRYIVLKGSSGSTTGTITIDLVNGTMSGATLNGGSW